LSLLRKELKVQEGKYIYKFAVGLKVDEDDIWFQQIGFSKILNRAIKTFSGYKWHGRDEPPIKKWSIKNCHRNVFQLQHLWGEDMYVWWKRPLELMKKEQFDRPQFKQLGLEIKPAQIDMISRGLQYRYQILAAEQGLGKSLAAIEIMERSGKKEWWFVGPKSALASVEREFKKWGSDPSIKIRMMSYERLTKIMRYEFDGLIPPDGIFFDESSALKTPTSKRSIAAQAIADLIREKHGLEGYVILLSGTPSAKHPTDLWSQCEIAWPGFIKEGSFRAFERRYAIMEDIEDMDGIKHSSRTGWRKEEVARLPNRYKGLMPVYRKKDWLKLPPKKYRKINLEPSKKTLRVAKSLCKIAPNAITALTWMRALSSGFQYVNAADGEKECPVCKGTGVYDYPHEGTCPGCLGNKTIPDYKRQTKRVKCLKDNALRDILDENEIHGRLVVAASFQGSIDRILDVCKGRGWAVTCVDGRGWRCYDNQGGFIKDDPMDFWEENHGKVCFVCNPGSARFGLTLTLAHTLLFYDNNFSAEHRLQMQDRIHRMSMDITLGANIIDLIHLPVDQLVLDTLNDNKELEHLSLGVIEESLGFDEEDEDEDD